MSDFKTNEYANLLGGAAFEPREENPMLGFRGASRYYSPRYRDGFALECRAIRRLREQLGFRNVIVMIPFCRTPEEADRVLRVMADNGLVRGRDGLKVYVMCEIPSNVIQAEEFARRFDGFSIGSNDLTQLTLGVDRDSDELAPLFSESNASVTWMIETVIGRAHHAGASVGLCGEAPSSHPEFARFLVGAGIDSISVNPASFLAVKASVAEAEHAAQPQLKAMPAQNIPSPSHAMHLPLEIDFGHVPPSASVKSAVRAGAARLNRYCPDIIGCHVTLPHSQARGEAHAPSQIQVRLTLPGTTVEVCHPQHAHEDVESAIHAAFDDMHLRLEEWLTARHTGDAIAPQAV